MLKNHLTVIKGRLLKHFSEIYEDMNLEGDGTFDYEEYYLSFIKAIQEISQIDSVSALDKFCEEWGLNDMGSEFAFYNLAKEYLEIKLEA